MSGSRVLWGQVALVLLIVFVAIWSATEWTAWRLSFQPQLGTPWFMVAGWPFYDPPAFFWWWYFYDAYAPSIFVTGGYIASSGGIIGSVVAIALSILRARDARNVATYGSARWADVGEVKEAGLLDPDGVVLGRWDRDYLRHNGPEHVLCFAPTRSGKGVGLVVPTLLTWPGSAIVHDIKRAMMSTPHLGKAGVHPVIASSARELLNKSDNERSGVLSTAMSFLGLYRDPVVAKVTARCDWRIADLVSGSQPASLYLVVPPSDIARTKPLIRLILNQIGRRLTEDLHVSAHRHRLLLMLDEFPALGRLDFFESALAFMAGYGIKSFLIAQSLNQIEKAYGANNSILDNCHVRVAFATNDERTARRVSDALGTATEMRDSTNYAGHRLSPWLGHLMVSRQETARPLLTPGEVMQLPPTDELLLIAGVAPVRAKKARYYEDARFMERVLPPPATGMKRPSAPPTDDWSALETGAPSGGPAPDGSTGADGDSANAGIRREPELPEHEDVVPPERSGVQEFDVLDDEPDDDAAKARAIRQQARFVARQATMDPADGLDL
ncbi:type IV secretory system conjugative DNA transfer family protein [Gluconobacter sp.]|uniref:type IV secretory system conjugative DNA transfer family protein n=1 Tax=Gluconobacter sp. TaxID=1876758 RepID=UPI0039EB9C66